MKKLVLALLALGLVSSAAFARGSHAVRGHITKKGAYVAPTRATNPDKSKANNYSHVGNVNPATGKAGTKQ